MFERIMIVVITIIWITMLLFLISLLGWWLISELVSIILKFLLII